MLEEPLSFPAAKGLIRSILESGEFRISGHAYEEMDDDEISEVDVVNVLRGGIVEACDFEKASWRYRVRTPRFTVVVTFRSETSLVVVTAWRNG